jgi:hypothetical protein
MHPLRVYRGAFCALTALDSGADLPPAVSSNQSPDLAGAGRKETVRFARDTTGNLLLLKMPAGTNLVA